MSDRKLKTALMGLCLVRLSCFGGDDPLECTASATSIPPGGYAIIDLRCARSAGKLPLEQVSSIVVRGVSGVSAVSHVYEHPDENADDLFENYRLLLKADLDAIPATYEVEYIVNAKINEVAEVGAGKAQLTIRSNTDTSLSAPITVDVVEKSPGQYAHEPNGLPVGAKFSWMAKPSLDTVLATPKYDGEPIARRNRGFTSGEKTNLLLLVAKLREPANLRAYDYAVVGDTTPVSSEESLELSANREVVSPGGDVRVEAKILDSSGQPLADLSEYIFSWSVNSISQIAQGPSFRYVVPESAGEQQLLIRSEAQKRNQTETDVEKIEAVVAVRVSGLVVTLATDSEGPFPVGSSITVTSSVSGGSGRYVYTWRADDTSFEGSGPVITIPNLMFTTSVHLTVVDQGTAAMGEATLTLPARTESNGLVASCYARQQHISRNGYTSFVADVFEGTPTIFEWSFDNGATFQPPYDPPQETPSTQFSEVGVHWIVLRVSDGTLTHQSSCRVEVR